jgi:hypothetical protein
MAVKIYITVFLGYDTPYSSWRGAYLKTAIGNLTFTLLPYGRKVLYKYVWIFYLRMIVGSMFKIECSDILIMT